MGWSLAILQGAKHTNRKVIPMHVGEQSSALKGQSLAHRVRHSGKAGISVYPEQTPAS